MRRHRGPGGTIANIGVHGVKADLHLEQLWSHNITITTRLVDTVTTPMLLKTVQSRRIDPQAVDHPSFHFRQNPGCLRYLCRAAETHALKVLIAALVCCAACDRNVAQDTYCARRIAVAGKE